jgi:putative transcriptional regulator
MKKLKDLRKKNNLTYDDMANLLNISKTFYWQLENNKRRIFYKQAIAIAKIFNLKPDDIFYEELI